MGISLQRRCALRLPHGDQIWLCREKIDISILKRCVDALRRGGSVQSHFNGVHMDSGRGGWSISHLCRRCWGLISIYFHQLSILKYNMDSGRLQQGRGFRHNLWTAGKAWRPSSMLETHKKNVCIRQRLGVKSTIITSAEMGRGALWIGQREKKKKKASMLVSFISISFTKPLPRWHNGADIKRSRAGGWTKTTATSEQKQGCAGAADLSWGHNGL